MKIALSADHRGATCIRQLADKLKREGHEAIVVGDCASSSCDYPERAYEVGHMIADKRADLGILVCGTGIGMSIAANKVKGVRAAVVHDELTAQLCRSHSDANVICMSADLLGQRIIEKIVDSWLGASFEGGRHSRRIRKIAAIEQGTDPATVTD
jgi:ribose 5-phosphate isomerase B